MASTVVGLDLGGTGLRAVQLTMAKGMAKVEKVAVAALPPGAVESGQIKDTEAVSTALKELWTRAKLKSKTVAFGVANQHVLVRQMDLEWMPEEDFGKALKYQAADVIPMKVDEVTVDYHTLAEYETSDADGQTRRMKRILLVVAENESVNSFVNAIQGAGLQAVQAEIVPFALVRAADPRTLDPGVVEVLIDIGADVTNVVIHQGGQPRFVRIMTGQAGSSLTNALMSEYGWTVEEAERTKVALGLAAQHPVASAGDSVFGSGAASGVAEVEEHPAQAVISQTVSTFINEIRTSVDFFLTSMPDVTGISRVVLTGGGGMLKGLSQRLASELRVPVQHVSPFDHVGVGASVEIPSEVSPQQLAVAVGLARGVN